MDAFYERLIVRAATIDELLSDEFEALPGQKGDADLAGRRLAAWCQSCASGDWALFSRRLERDGLSINQVLERFATVRRRASSAPPAWIADAIWIDAALQSSSTRDKVAINPNRAAPIAFEHLFTAVVEQADAMLWSGIAERTSNNLNESARACLRMSLLKTLSRLSTPAIYERFAEARKASAIRNDSVAPPQAAGTSRYDQFITDMKNGGFRRLFEDKPVLLRLIATVTRQWLDTWREFIMRLDTDIVAIRRDILGSTAAAKVADIAGDLSDPHNNGHSVQIVAFEDGSRIVYKPKDLRVDAAWYALVERLNRDGSPLALIAVHAMPRDGYGWTEFIDHTECEDQEGCKRFFRRAGAWLALFHCFAATDTHQENMIAIGDHPVPIDLEMILQAPPEEHKTNDPDGAAFDAAMETVGNSVMMVGLLPAYGRSADNSPFAMGGMISDWTSKTILTWSNINSDDMRPAKSKLASDVYPNLPHVRGRYAKFGDHIEDFVSGFEEYAKFLVRYSGDETRGALFDGFAGLPVRRVIRPTRFYYMLLQRLKNSQAMNDGVFWSAQADFVARLAEWQNDSDPIWLLHRAERTALVVLNVPHFLSPSDKSEVRDAYGSSIRIDAISGLERARARMQSFDQRDIDWQTEVIRENTNSVSRSNEPPAARVEHDQLLRSAVDVTPSPENFLAEADRIAAELFRLAIRRGPSAAWIGLDWLGDSEVFQLVCLGPDLYNGVTGIAVFLAAHSRVANCSASGELALAGLSHLRRNLNGRNSARMARSVGIGGATGMGSIVYALAVAANFLGNDELLAQADAAARLVTDELIAADKQFDVMGGSAGAILGLLRLYRDTQSPDILGRAMKCGDHLLAQQRLGQQGSRSWAGQSSGARGLNGMSHGAAGFAYALASLSTATGREDFAQASSECIAFEDSSYDAARKNWPDLRSGGEPLWPCQWCHGAPGIGLARLAMTKGRGVDAKRLAGDIGNAVEGAERGWPARVDTLCCGTLGSIEFFCEAGKTLGRSDLRDLAARRMTAVLERAASTGDYRWNSGKRQFNLGFFRGLAGVGYTLLRRVDPTLPNVLVWE